MILGGEEQHFGPHLGEYVDLLPDKGQKKHETHLGQILVDGEINDS
jgi:hypothetical protein